MPQALPTIFAAATSCGINGASLPGSVAGIADNEFNDVIALTSTASCINMSWLAINTGAVIGFDSWATVNVSLMPCATAINDLTVDTAVCILGTSC